MNYIKDKVIKRKGRKIFKILLWGVVVLLWGS